MAVSPEWNLTGAKPGRTPKTKLRGTMKQVQEPRTFSSGRGTWLALSSPSSSSPSIIITVLILIVIVVAIELDSQTQDHGNKHNYKSTRNPATRMGRRRRDQTSRPAAVFRGQILAHAKHSHSVLSSMDVLGQEPSKRMHKSVRSSPNLSSKAEVSS